MGYITKDEISAALDRVPDFREFLYARGFLITDEKIVLHDGYPFYGNWREVLLDSSLYIYAHRATRVFVHTDDNETFFLVGHAYNPYKMLSHEEDVLKDLCISLKKSEEAYCESVSELTGVHVLGYVRDDRLVYANDATGMQLTYSGVIDNHVYVTSFAKLVADLKDLRQPEYIQRITSGRFWRYWGIWLPGDLSPFEEMKRVVPNNAYTYDFANHRISHFRFYPLTRIVETDTEDEYRRTIHELGRVMANTMKCISEKWPDKKVSISVTGGRDSTTTLACSRDIFDRFRYFSYASNAVESVDACTAKDLVERLGLEHELYRIPDEYDDYRYLDEFAMLMQCNSGCIGENNPNDLKKRLYFLKNRPCDIEVKSWVNELGRAFYYSKYRKRRFPRYPTCSYLRAMHKIYLSRYAIENTDKVFEKYWREYCPKEIMDNLNWVVLYSWEFGWSAGEGCTLTGEHRITYDITIPFNNRRYINTMMTVPLEKRVADRIPIDLVRDMEPRIAEAEIAPQGISHTKLSYLLVRVYLEIFSKIRFEEKGGGRMGAGK